jgi:hypothetical protein
MGISGKRPRHVAPTMCDESEIWSLDDSDFAEKLHSFQIDEPSKFATQNGLIFGLVLGR